MAQFPFLSFCRHSLCYRMLSAFFNDFSKEYFTPDGKTMTPRDSALYSIYEKLLVELRSLFEEVVPVGQAVIDELDTRTLGKIGEYLDVSYDRLGL